MPPCLRNIFFLMLVFFQVAGCNGPSEEKPAPKTAASREARPGEPVYGGRIVKAMLGDATNLIPPLATDSGSHEIASLLYVSPLKYDKDIHLVPFAAESYEVLEDGKLLRFHLRPNLRWADGRELTADDVEFTYKLMIDPKTPTAYGEDFKAISAFTVTDKYTFEVRYDRPFARALTTWTSEILPKHALDGQDLTNTAFSRAPLGAGPFQLKGWEAGRDITLAVNPDYFEGRAYLDEALYRIIPDLSTMFLELKAGNLDEMGLTPQQYLYQTKGPEWDENFRKFKYLAFSYVYMGYNLRQPLFSDVRVRVALAHAIDKREIIAGVLMGLGLPTIGPYTPGTWMYNDAFGRGRLGGRKRRPDQGRQPVFLHHPDQPGQRPAGQDGHDHPAAPEGHRHRGQDTHRGMGFVFKGIRGQGPLRRRDPGLVHPPGPGYLRRLAFFQGRARGIELRGLQKP